MLLDLKFLNIVEENKKRYYKKGAKFSIERLGKCFSENIREPICHKGHDVYILPVLHNSANLQFDKSKRFIPEDKQGKYLTYYGYVAKNIGDILFKDEKIGKEYFKKSVATKYIITLSITKIADIKFSTMQKIYRGRGVKVGIC